MRWEVDIVYEVLLVDPDHESREKMKKMVDWSRWGFALRGYAATSADAMDLFTSHSFSLVVINIRSGRADGMLLCGQIRKTAGIPIILIGGKESFQLARKALHYKVSDYLPDPVSPEDLLASLRRIKGELDFPFPCSPQKSETLSFREATSRPPANVIDKVKEYVKESLHQNITLKEISEILHFNCTYLGQKFKQHENMTFHEYLLRQRMEKAKFLLRHTDMKVYEIANEVGYSDLDWFYKKFKAYTGVSANQYRKMVSITA
jgi:YesN/AraC family two-component response regulator